MDGLVDAAVDGEVALLVAVDVEAADHDGTFDGQLEDAGAHLLPHVAYGKRPGDLN